MQFFFNSSSVWRKQYWFKKFESFKKNISKKLKNAKKLKQTGIEDAVITQRTFSHLIVCEKSYNEKKWVIVAVAEKQQDVKGFFSECTWSRMGYSNSANVDKVVITVESPGVEGSVICNSYRLRILQKSGVWSQRRLTTEIIAPKDWSKWDRKIRHLNIKYLKPAKFVLICECQTFDYTVKKGQKMFFSFSSVEEFQVFRSPGYHFMKAFIKIFTF